MSINKDLFSEHFKNKDYAFCSNILRNEIIDILTKRIQEKNPDYKYTDTRLLKIECFRHLSDIEQDVAVELYDLELIDNTLYYELSRMMELYKTLI